MKRGEFVRTAFKPSEAKPASGKPKMRKCQNRACRRAYEVDPRHPFKRWCDDDCAVVIASERLAKMKAAKKRQERAQDKAKLDTFKTYPQLIAVCQKAFNAVVRHRDMAAGHRCISSGRVLNWSGNKVDCGHFRSTGSAPHLRFNFDNAHAQDKHDNLWKSGNAVDYRIGLIARIGLERVEALEADNTPAKWSHDDLRRMTKEFQAQLRAMKKSEE